MCIRDSYPVKLKRGAAQVSGCRDSYRITLNFNSYGITLNFNSASEGLLSSRRWWVRNDTGPALPAVSYTHLLLAIRRSAADLAMSGSPEQPYVDCAGGEWQLRPQPLPKDFGRVSERAQYSARLRWNEGQVNSRRN